jgi:DNA-binding transcriptional ArsR family regulator
MVAAANLVEVAALVGDTARATMLNALMGGQSLTATELAYCANVSRSTASGHLSKLVSARLLTVTRKRRCTSLCAKLLRSPGWPGRSRYYRRTCGHGAHYTHR